MTVKKIGMLWFDNDPQTTTREKIERAANYYRRKYGLPAVWVQVHPFQASDEQAAEIGRALGLEVTRSAKVLRNHFWIGAGL